MILFANLFHKMHPSQVRAGAHPGPQEDYACRSPKFKVSMMVHPKRVSLSEGKCPSLLSGVGLGLLLLLVAA